MPLKGLFSSRLECRIPSQNTQCYLTADQVSRKLGVRYAGLGFRFSALWLSFVPVGAMPFHGFFQKVLSYCDENHSKLRHSQPELAHESIVSSGWARPLHRDSRTSKRFLQSSVIDSVKYVDSYNIR